MSLPPSLARAGFPGQANDVRCLGGIRLDTVEALTEGTFDPRAARALRDVWKAVAISGEPWNERELDDYHATDPAELPRSVLGPALTAHTRGRGAVYPLMLIGPHWSLFSNPWTSRAKLVVRAEHLATTTRAEIVLELRRIAWWLFRTDATSWRLSRLDLAADCTGLDLEAFADLGACVTRAVGKRIHLDTDDEAAELEPSDFVDSGTVAMTRARMTGVTLGTPQSRVQFCIYDKVEQAKVKGLTWVTPLLEAGGWDGAESVVRVEARFRQRALDEFPAFPLRDVESLNTFEKWALPLWRYATESTTRYTIPNDDSNRSRWPTRPDWLAVQSFGAELAAQRIRSVSLEVQEERRRRASRDVVRGLVSLAAESEATSRIANTLMRQALEKGLLPEAALAAAVFAAQGDLIGERALRCRAPDERVLELRTRLERKTVWHAWSDDPARAHWPVERRTTARSAVAEVAA